LDIGPTRIGVDSCTNTVRPQPLAHATTSAAKMIAVNVGVHSHPVFGKTPVKPRSQRDDDMCDDALEHGAFSSYQSS
jgi:hypothetical protein